MLDATDEPHRQGAPFRTGGITVLGATIDLPRAPTAQVAHGAWLNPASANYPAVVLGGGAAQTLGIEHVNPAVAIGGGAGILAGIPITADYAHIRHWSTSIPATLPPERPPQP